MEETPTGILTDIYHRPSTGILILSDVNPEETPESPSLDLHKTNIFQEEQVEQIRC